MGFNQYTKLLQSLINTSRSRTTTYTCSSLYSNQLRRSVTPSSPSSSDPKSFSTISSSSYHLNGGPSYMRGAVFWEPNKPMTFEDFEMPRPKVNEVLIKTKGMICENNPFLLLIRHFSSDFHSTALKICALNLSSNF